ncbi:hypothetical protein BH23VER1_BH23VER1_36720 [soil metagenome]
MLCFRMTKVIRAPMFTRCAVQVGEDFVDVFEADAEVDEFGG